MIPQRLLSAIKTGRVVLFLGAGANYHCKLDDGSRMPLGNELSVKLSEKFNVRCSNLAETAELVEANHSRDDLNAFIAQLLTGATASESFRLINSFLWTSIYSTNYDLLVEETYRLPNARQNLKVYYSSLQQIDLGINDVPLYKLHGCISCLNTPDGKLIITPDDYASYRRNRARLFHRLADHLCDRPFLYLGYGRQDPNFRSILADVHEEMIGNLPEGFALFPNKTEEDDKVWSKKGVTLIDMDVDAFLQELHTSLPDRFSTELPKLDFPLPKQYEQINHNVMSEALTYFSLPVAKYGDVSNPHNFYKGSEAQWIDLSLKVDATRDLYEEIMGELLEDAVSIDYHATSYCILAEAGAGKSTLLRRLSVDMLHDFQQCVFWFKGERRISFEIVSTLYHQTGKRIFIFVDRGSKYLGNLDSLRRDCTAAKIPLTILIADRANEWNYSGGSSFRFNKEWNLKKLSDWEIERILLNLERFNCLGNLLDLSLDERKKRFKTFSDRQLLVALREATEGNDFDELIIEECDSIPNHISRQSYYHICAFNAFGKGIRTSVLARSLGINLITLAEVLKPLEGLVNWENEIYSARHAIISKIVFFSLTESARIDLLERLIRRLDLGYTSDYHLFKDLSTNEDLIDSLGNVDIRRRLYAVLKEVNPTDAYIEQHEARMEIRSVNEGGSLDRAEKLIKSALKRTNGAITIRHTAGMLYTHRSYQSVGKIFEKRSYLTRAVQEFVELTKRAPTNDYMWVSLIDARLSLGALSESEEGKFSENSRAEADYDRAVDLCGPLPYLLRSKGKIEAAWGHGDQAREYFTRAISTTAPPVELFINYIKWELRHKKAENAKRISQQALSIYNNNPEIQLLTARSIILSDSWTMEDVAYLLLEVQRSTTGILKMDAYFWHAVALWESERYREAMNQFNIGKELAFSLGRNDIKHIRYFSGMNHGQHRVYKGSIVEQGPRIAWLLCNPGGERVFVNVKDLEGRALRDLKIVIGFNRMGPVAKFDEITETEA